MIRDGGRPQTFARFFLTPDFGGVMTIRAA